MTKPSKNRFLITEIREVYGEKCYLGSCIDGIIKKNDSVTFTGNQLISKNRIDLLVKLQIDLPDNRSVSAIVRNIYHIDSSVDSLTEGFSGGLILSFISDSKKLHTYDVLEVDIQSKQQ